MTVERDEAVVVAAVPVDEGDDAGCRLTHARVNMLEVLTPCLYRLEMISPSQGDKTNSSRPGCVL